MFMAHSATISCSKFTQTFIYSSVYTQAKDKAVAKHNTKVREKSQIAFKEKRGAFSNRHAQRTTGVSSADYTFVIFRPLPHFLKPYALIFCYCNKNKTV